jgi:sulfide:quinone oxidoreductase
VKDFEVVICGGGIAALECLLRLRRIAADQLHITLVSPNPEFDYRPLAVLESFGETPARTFPMKQIVADSGVRWLPQTLSHVDRHSRTIVTSSGDSVQYDALLIATGGRPRPINSFMDAFSSSRGPAMYQQLLAEIDSGRLTTLAFVIPEGLSWPLPLYELALMTSHRARTKGLDLTITMAIPGTRPLEMFGGNASARVGELLVEAGIDVYYSAIADMTVEGRLSLHRARLDIPVERTITLPQISGPDVRGIPGDAIHRFVPIDTRCRVRGTDGHVFAAGDATDTPIKHGGLSAQQADTAADGIAHLAGRAQASRPLYPVLRGKLITGDKPLYLSAQVVAGRGWNADISEDARWAPDDLVVASELNSYLASLSI